MKQIVFIMVALFISTSFRNPVTNCEAAITTLISHTQTATSLTDRDKSGLLQTAQNSLTDYMAGKTAGALNKLYDYRSKLVQLLNAAKPKISVADYNILFADAEAAIGCISG